MKVGIITMPLCANYGGTLQNWALQQVLIKMGHEPITLRFPVMYQGMSSAHYWLKVFPMQFARFVAHKLLGGKYEMPLTIGSWKKSVSGMESFVDKHINVTEYLPNLTMDDVKRYGIEALLVGSDQIWRPVMYDAIKYYFLGFAKDFDILRVAYAPSVALDYWPYNEETTAQLRGLVKKFAAVSVREESSVKLVKDNLGVDAQWVLDPTLLLSKDEYLDVCREEPQSDEHFVFAYILDMSDEKRKMAEQKAKRLNCGVKYLTADKVQKGDTIERWLGSFRDSAFVITDSYHGLVFSLIFQKQFYCFYNDYRGNARMNSLRKLLGLEDRFISKPIVEDLQDFDYTLVAEKLEMKKKQSVGYLQRSLSGRDVKDVNSN